MDLAACVRALARYPARIYDRFFTRELLAQVHASPTLSEHAARIFARWRPTRLVEFDDAFTAPMSGFGDAATYYRQCSAAPLLARIHVTTTILASEDDPIVPCGPLAAAPRSSQVTLLTTRHGGHLGFLAQSGRWLDGVVADALR